MLEKLTPKEGWITLLLPWLMLMTTAIAIDRADLVRNIPVDLIVASVGALGFIAGIALAKSQFPSGTAHIYSAVYGIFAYAFVLGRAVFPGMPWRERIIELVTRQATWLNDAISGSTNRDSLIFVMHAAALFWLLGYTMAWYTTRKPRPWLVILPAGLTLLSIVYYYTGPRRLELLLGVYLVLSLIFIAYTFLNDRKKEWRKEWVRFDRDVSFNFLRSSFLIAVVALTLAWQIPAFGANTTVSGAVRRVDEPWREFRQEWQRMFSALNASGQKSADPYLGSLGLGGPRNVGDTLIMDVNVPRKLSYAYWRSSVYSEYVGGDWKPVPGEEVEHYPEEGPIDVAPTKGRQQVRQVFTNYINNAGSLYGAPDMLRSDQQLIMKTAYDETGAMMPLVTRSRHLLQLGDQYEIYSMMSNASASNLRTANTQYPPWVYEGGYLTVPDEITQRTKDLAVEVTTGLDNPYDIALTTQNFLREHIEYNDQISLPPQEFDKIDYVLFEEQQGYCTYYASAMAMMLRSQGIPTRLGRGFAAGEYVDEGSFYRVRARDAHTWVEVFFPDYGWIQFEPTAIIAVPVRPEGNGNNTPADTDPNDRGLLEDDEPLPEDAPPVDEPLPEEDVASSGWFSLVGENGVIGTLPALGAGIILIAAAATIVFANRFNKQVEEDVDRSYGRLVSWGRRIGVAIFPSHTPYERADAIVAMVPEGEQPIRALVDEFVVRKFSPDKKGSILFHSLEEWKALRPILVKKTMHNLVPKRFRGEG